MPVHERRQHFRIDDQIYFDYHIVNTDNLLSDNAMTKELLGKNGQRYLEMTQYFKSLDNELKEISKNLSLKEPSLVHSINLMNAKIDYLTRYLLIGERVKLNSVNISLGGMAFQSKERIKEKSHMKLVIYTKPKMMPTILDAVVVYSQYQQEGQYRTAVQFEPLNEEQEQLLSQHIMLAQIKGRGD